MDDVLDFETGDIRHIGSKRNNAATVPNQNVVHIHRDLPKEKEGGFLMVKKSSLYAAYRDLNSTALVLYLYLAGNKDGYKLALSPQAIFNEVGMPISTCKDQIKKLIKKGYLVRKGEGSNQYDFYEKPVGREQTDGVQNDGPR